MLIGDDVHSVFLMLLIGTDALQWLISSPSLSLALSLRFISFALPASFLLMAYWLIDVPDVFFFSFFLLLVMKYQSFIPIAYCVQVCTSERFSEQIHCSKHMIDGREDHRD